MNTLFSSISTFQPGCEQEAADKALMLQLMQQRDDLLDRSSLAAHFTASGLVVDPFRTQTVFAYHRIYDSYAWLGGHADGCEDLLSVALREVREESGLKSIRPVSTDLFSLEVLTVDAHIRRGQFVPSHLHLNLTYLIEADPSEPLSIRPDENTAVQWFSFEEALASSKEPWMVKWVYQKLFERVRALPRN